MLDNIKAAFSPVYLGGMAYLAYIIAVPTTAASIRLFVCNVLTKDWTTILSPIYTGVYNSLNLGVATDTALFGGAADRARFVYGVGFNLVTMTLVIGTLDSTQGSNLTYPPNSTEIVVLPVEEVSMFKDVTVNAIGFYCDNNGASAIITPSVNGVAFSPIILNSVSGKLYMSYPAVGGFCDKYPQLTLNIASLSTTQFRIYKISMFCSVDMNQVP